jgi:hypothetical protein
MGSLINTRLLLFASYGFALTEKEATKTDDEISLAIDDTNEE